MSWGEFLAMDGRAFYVWGSFGAMALCILIELVGLRWRALRERDARTEERAVASTLRNRGST